MELETYTPLGPKFVFEKIKFKFWQHIQHDFIANAQGSVKITLSCSQRQRRQMFLFYKGRCDKCSVEIE